MKKHVFMKLESLLMLLSVLFEYEIQNTALAECKLAGVAEKSSVVCIDFLERMPFVRLVTDRLFFVSYS